MRWELGIAAIGGVIVLGTLNIMLLDHFGWRATNKPDLVIAFVLFPVTMLMLVSFAIYLLATMPFRRLHDRHVAARDRRPPLHRREDDPEGRWLR